MDTSELVSGKSPLEDPPDISALDCPGSPSLNHSDSFSLLADDSQPDTSLFGSANLPPVLGESVLQGKQDPPIAPFSSLINSLPSNTEAFA